MLWLHLTRTTAEAVGDGVFAMVETYLSCCLCGRIMARSHWRALLMTSCTWTTQCHGSFPDFATSHTTIFTGRT